MEKKIEFLVLNQNTWVGAYTFNCQWTKAKKLLSTTNGTNRTNQIDGSNMFSNIKFSMEMFPFHIKNQIEMVFWFCDLDFHTYHTDKSNVMKRIQHSKLIFTNL
ncbi:hypothetical protein BLOT_015395 [Blomia tropicalis]|nr:hypothetical protein BLOT_015395 [Blomia tropicalis]